MTKKSLSQKRVLRVFSIFMVVVIAMTTMVLPVFAAMSTTVSVTSSNTNKNSSVKVTSGKGILYSLRLKTTTITITNTGKNTVSVYETTSSGIATGSTVWKGDIGAGQTKTITLKGSGTVTKLSFQAKNNKKTTVKVSVNAGSVSVS